MKLKIMDYDKKSYTALDVPLKDVQMICVSVISGDEILTIIFKDGETAVLDVTSVNHNFRITDFYDGSYVVDNLELEKWNNRKDSYEWLWGKM